MAHVRAGVTGRRPFVAAIAGILAGAGLSLWLPVPEAPEPGLDVTYVPRWVPEPYVLSNVDVRSTGTPGGRWVDVSYRPADDAPTEARHVFSIHERIGVDAEGLLRQTEGREIDVRGETGIVAPAGLPIVTWAEDDDTLMSVGGPIPLAAVRRIAESLRPASCRRWWAYLSTAEDPLDTPRNAAVRNACTG